MRSVCRHRLSCSAPAVGVGPGPSPRREHRSLMPAGGAQSTSGENAHLETDLLLPGGFGHFSCVVFFFVFCSNISWESSHVRLSCTSRNAHAHASPRRLHACWHKWYYTRPRASTQAACMRAQVLTHTPTRIHNRCTQAGTNENAHTHAHSRPLHTWWHNLIDVDLFCCHATNLSKTN